MSVHGSERFVLVADVTPGVFRLTGILSQQIKPSGP